MYKVEIDRLAVMLDSAHIPHEVVPCCDGWQIFYPSAEKPIADVICHSMSHGHKQGLLEMAGYLAGKSANYYDNVQGYMTALDAFEKILNSYMIR